MLNFERGSNNDSINSISLHNRRISGSKNPLDQTEDVKNCDIYVSEYRGEGKMALSGTKKILLH